MADEATELLSEGAAPPQRRGRSSSWGQQHSVGANGAVRKDPKWGGTPNLRRRYSTDTDAILLDASVAARSADRSRDDQTSSPTNNVRRDTSYGTGRATRGATSRSPRWRRRPRLTFLQMFAGELKKLPGLLIGIILNLMLAVPFGSSFFPLDWHPFPVNRLMGIQMWLFSTAVCQLVMTFRSDFPHAMGMQMVENLPYFHSLADNAILRLGMGKRALATVMVTFALGSVVVGIAFLLLGHFKLGNATYFFPRHVIVGCIGGIGLFVTQTGVEVATNTKWEWSMKSIEHFGRPAIMVLYLVPVGLEVLLRVLLRLFSWNLLPPFFFIAIPPVFYLTLLAMGVPVEDARAHGFFFEKTAHAEPTLMWEVMDLRMVDWSVVGSSWPTIIALTIFSLMHAPINIPSLSISTHVEVDMNQELIAHGISNLATGFCGGLQNYLCYSNSLLYARCGGGGRIQGFLMTCLLVLFFIIGPDAVSLVPRCMAGCLLIHVGLDLTGEALIDSVGHFDSYEYGSILLITVVMTVKGVTAGLAVGVLAGTLTFTMQQARHANAVRGVMTAATLRSSKWRNAEETELLFHALRRIVVIQLQGNIFFGNSAQILSKLRMWLERGQGDLQCVILDFTLVTGIDSSATETIAKAAQLCRSYGDFGVCFCRGTAAGFPCAAPLSQRLEDLEGEGFQNDEETASDPGARWLSLQDDLDSALVWCEDRLLRAYDYRPNPARVALPVELRQIQALLCDVRLARIKQLVSYFEERSFVAGKVLWNQGEVSKTCYILLQGRLVSILEEEAGTTEDILPGAMVGEFGFVNNRRRGSTLTCRTAGKLLCLTREGYERMRAKDAELALLLARICIGYLERRVAHVSNRIWESRCLPI